MGGDPDQHVVGICLGIFHKNIEIAMVVKDARVQQLILEIVKPPATVFCHQISVRKRRLGVFVEHFQVAVSRCAVQIKVVLLDILTVVALRTRQAEEALI